MSYAGHNAIKTACAGGHFATVSAHSNRWKQFCQWAKEQGIKDAKNIHKATLQAYSDYLLSKDYSASYSQNLLSSCNAVLEALREDNKVSIRPLQALGKTRQRELVRKTAPECSFSQIEAISRILQDKGDEKAAAVVWLCRTLGLRSQEAAMFDSRRALIEYKQRGVTNITEGTKGGRGHFIDRWVPVSPQAESALLFSTNLQGQHNNLIPDDKTCHQFLAQVRTATKDVLKEHQISSLHELRAAYACDRYFDLTGQLAPCITGKLQNDKSVDLSAREVITQELGHGRIDVVAAYVGGRS